MTSKIRSAIFLAQHQDPGASFLERTIHDVLRDDGARCRVLTCDGILNGYCTTMSALGLTIAAPNTEKDQACSRCRRARFAWWDLHAQAEIVRIEKRIDARRLATIVEELEGQSTDELLRFTLDGIPFGQAAVYETILHEKRASKGDLSSIPATDLQSFMHNAIAAYLA
jgi:hypothetical protein